MDSIFDRVQNIVQSKESTHPLVFTSTKWARTSDFFPTLSSSRTSNLTSYFYIPTMVFDLFLCIGQTKYRAGIQILMICNPDLC